LVYPNLAAAATAHLSAGAAARFLVTTFNSGFGHGFACLEVAQQQISSGPVVILYMLPFAAAMVLLAARIWQAAALPASQPQPEPTPVPASSM
jgi:hypothetical protein